MPSPLSPPTPDDLEERRIRTLHRTYGRKKGHLTGRQEAWLAELLPRLELPVTATRQELAAVLGADPGSARLWLEVGFGNGEFLVARAAAQPGDRFIGVEVFLEGIAACLHRMEQAGVANLRVVRENAFLLLRDRLPPEAFDRVVINFPDPWPKTRHHKRRLVQGPFMALVARVLRPGGVVTLATDWEEYARQMLAVGEGEPGLVNLAGRGRFAEEPEGWVVTRFQEKGRAAGRPTWHLVFGRPVAPPSEGG